MRLVKYLKYLLGPLLVFIVLFGGALMWHGGAGAQIVPVAAAQTAGTGSAGSPFAGITVSGSGTATAAPDIAYVSAGVETQAATAQQASTTNSTAMAAVIAAIKAQGVTDQDIQTTNFSIDPVYSQPQTNNGTPSITGYRVSNSVTATVATVGNAGNVLDAAVKAGANNNVGIRFGIKDATALQEQALKTAVQRAGAKAGSIASAAGVKLTGVYSIAEQGTGTVVPQPMGAGAQASAAAVPVQQGQLTVTATVEAIYTYTR
jgi:uncharacterized protein YggE